MNGADGGCSSCPSAGSTPAIPPALTGTKMVLPSGIAGWVALRSDESFVNITLQAEWEGYITAGTMIVRMDGCRVRGSKPDSTTVSKRRGACSIEEVVKRNQAWEIIDVGNDDDYTMHDLYGYILDNYKCFKFGLITCDYRLYGFDGALIKMTITTEKSGLVKPRIIPFLPNLAGLIN